MPTPVEIQPFHRQFILDASFTIVHDAATANEAEFLAMALTDVLVDKLAVDKPTDGAKAAARKIRLGIGDVNVGDEIKRPGDEAYVLTIHPETGIEISGTDPAGVFYGIQTLRALFPIAAYRQPAKRVELEAVPYRRRTALSLSRIAPRCRPQLPVQANGHEAARPHGLL